MVSEILAVDHERAAFATERGLSWLGAAYLAKGLHSSMHALYSVFQVMYATTSCATTMMRMMRRMAARIPMSIQFDRAASPAAAVAEPAV